MHAYTQSYWDEQKKLAGMSMADRLDYQADAEERRGDGFKNCMWTGHEHPSESHYRQAALLRQAAARIRYQEQAGKRAAETRKRKKQAVIDSMEEDRDF